MSTRAEQAKTEEQRKKSAAKRKSAPKKSSRMNARADESGAPANENVRAGEKATVAKEEVAAGERPSRKSTRASKNRGKADTNLVLRAERAARSPENRARKANVKNKKARGSGKGSTKKK